MVSLAPSAVAQVKRVQAAGQEHAGKALRVFVTKGGCSGWSYGFRFDAPHPADRSASFDGVDVVVDPDSLPLLEGCVITYEQQGLSAGAFRVTNPNAAGTCGCGQSFAPGAVAAPAPAR